MNIDIIYPNSKIDYSFKCDFTLDVQRFRKILDLMRVNYIYIPEESRILLKNISLDYAILINDLQFKIRLK